MQFEDISETNNNLNDHEYNIIDSASVEPLTQRKSQSEIIIKPCRTAIDSTKKSVNIGSILKNFNINKRNSNEVIEDTFILRNSRSSTSSTIDDQELNILKQFQTGKLLKNDSVNILNNQVCVNFYLQYF